MSNEADNRPKDGYWVIRHWVPDPRDMDLRGQFTAAELRWLADKLDEFNRVNKGQDL